MCPNCNHPIAKHNPPQEAYHPHYRDSARMMGEYSRMFLNFNDFICSVCKEFYIGDGCLGSTIEMDSGTWTEFDEQEWQSLLASEPANVNRGNSKQGKDMIDFEHLAVRRSQQSWDNPAQGEDMINLQRNNIPQGNQTAARGVQFLKPLHIKNPNGEKAKILKVTIDKPDNFGNPVTVFFSFGGARYSKGFKLTSDNLASLVGILGADETKWAGKPVTIGKSADDDGAERLVFTK